MRKVTPFHRVRCRRDAAVAAVLCLLAGGPALAGDNAVHFAIHNYQIEGSQLFSAAILQRAVAPYTGTDASFALIEQAVAALQQVYADAGYSATRIAIAPQDITSGVIHLSVIETPVGTVDITGNQQVDSANVRATLPALREGQPPDLHAIGTGIRLANDNYAKQTQITFRQGAQPDTLDATIKVADANPVRHVISLDNTGTGPTGNYRLGYAFQHANLFKRDQMLTAQYVTSPDHLRQVTILGLSYHVPLYAYGGAIDLSASHANVSSGQVTTTAGSYALSGSGDAAGIRYTQLLPRIVDWDQRVSAGVDYHAYRNDVRPDGASSSLIPDLVTRPVTLSYAGFSRDVQREWRASFSLSQNLPGGVSNSTADYQAPGGRAGATASFRIWRTSVFLRQSLPADWQVQLQLNGQYSADALISGEQFGVGGVDSVRGFNEREVLNDYGYRTSVEFQGSNLGKAFGAAAWQVRPVLFHETGRLWRNHPLPAEAHRSAIASAGLGLRIALDNSMQARIDYATVLQGAGIRPTGDRKIQANFTLLF
ncbi:MAG: ShlB/FhaC/HecB family hemolysin secretion/activation protein [Oxalobacteraceae bacterium]|nr:ShlB/FhaC/HecB family hemolysin secretion/activation protein [Oxalobacteraceae bacterium]